MSCETESFDKDYRRRKKFEDLMDEDVDCPSLNWLLTFKVDNLICPKAEEKPVKRPQTPVIVVPPAAVLNDTFRYYDDRKPPYTYTELIERALRDKKQLTVKGIYKWISDRFPYYKKTEERWKNSVRHNLSINPHFRKGSRAVKEAGHLWTLAANAMDLLPKRTYPEFIDSSKMNGHHIQFYEDFSNVIIIDETALATASILPDNDFILEDTTFLNPVSSEQVIQECGLFSLD